MDIVLDLFQQFFKIFIFIHFFFLLNFKIFASSWFLYSCCYSDHLKTDLRSLFSDNIGISNGRNFSPLSHITDVCPVIFKIILLILKNQHLQERLNATSIYLVFLNILSSLPMLTSFYSVPRGKETKSGIKRPKFSPNSSTTLGMF